MNTAKEKREALAEDIRSEVMRAAPPSEVYAFRLAAAERRVRELEKAVKKLQRDFEAVRASHGIPELKAAA